MALRGVLLEQLADRGGGQAARVAGVAVGHLGGQLVAGQGDLLGVDDDDEVAGVDVRGEGRLVLAAQQGRGLDGEAAEDDVGGVDDVPLALDVSRASGCTCARLTTFSFVGPRRSRARSGGWRRGRLTNTARLARSSSCTAAAATVETTGAAARRSKREPESRPRLTGAARLDGRTVERDGCTPTRARAGRLPDPIRRRDASSRRGRHRDRQSLTVRDNRTGQEYDVPITDGTIRAADLGQIKADDDDARAGGLRPRLRQHRLLPQRGHLHRRRQGHPGVPRLPDRAAGREVELPRGRLPADPRRAADQGRSTTPGCTRSPTTRSCTRTSRRSCRASATTPTRWAC